MHIALREAFPGKSWEKAAFSPLFAVAYPARIPVGKKQRAKNNPPPSLAAPPKKRRSRWKSRSVRADQLREGKTRSEQQVGSRVAALTRHRGLCFVKEKKRWGAEPAAQLFQTRRVLPFAPCSGREEDPPEKGLMLHWKAALERDQARTTGEAQSWCFSRDKRDFGDLPALWERVKGRLRAKQGKEVKEKHLGASSPSFSSCSGHVAGLMQTQVEGSQYLSSRLMFS